MNLFLTFSVCWLIFLGYLMFRVKEVAKYRHHLLDKVSEACKQDIAHGNLNWFWRYEKYEEVSSFTEFKEESEKE